MENKKRLTASCEDCELPYQGFGIDLTLPHSQWLLIHPEFRGGLLCANCIMKRAECLPGIIAARTTLEIRFPHKIESSH